MFPKQLGRGAAGAARQARRGGRSATGVLLSAAVVVAVRRMLKVEDPFGIYLAASHWFGVKQIILVYVSQNAKKDPLKLLPLRGFR